MNSTNLGWETIKEYLIVKKVISRLFVSDFDRFIEFEDKQKKMIKENMDILNGRD